MPLSKQQWDEVTVATEKLRSLGCAVGVFTPDDVESAYHERNDDGHMTAEQSAAWMRSNRKYIEDGMSSGGNHYIADNIDEAVVS